MFVHPMDIHQGRQNSSTTAVTYKKISDAIMCLEERDADPASNHFQIVWFETVKLFQQQVFQIFKHAHIFYKLSS